MSATETLPRKLRVKLENAQDDPIEVTWERYECTVTPLVELFYHGQCYQPARRSPPNKRGELKVTPAQTFTAEVDQEIIDLWAAGKIAADIPYAQRGRAANGLPAYRPWVSTQKGVNPDPNSLDDTLVKVRMKPYKWVQIFPGMDLRELGHFACYPAASTLRHYLPGLRNNWFCGW
jgi:hypothetical protein